jgi:outer membrane lipoprotein-sorting protein
MILCALISTPLHPSYAQTGTLTAREILDKIDDLYRGDAGTGNMTMAIVTENWSRTLTMEFWAKGKDKSLIRILSPKKEQGTATLRVGNDIWNYLPKVNRTIKVSSSMMSQSWMGSHFTNDDLVRESRMADDYTFETTFDGERDGVRVIEITCIPKPEVAIVWGKVVLSVKSEGYIPLSILYYDETMNLVRTLTFADIKNIDGRDIPMKMTVIPSDKPDESTVVTYNEITFNLVIDDSVFSLRNLENS